MRNPLLIFAASAALAGTALAADPAPPVTTALPAVVEPAALPPGAFANVVYHWRATAPTGKGYTVFVHVLDEAGKMVFQGDHAPPVGTGTPGWIGEVSYNRRMGIPASLPDGVYRITLGLYDKEGRAPLAAGEGVQDLGGQRFEVARFTVDKSAPFPKADTEKEPTLNLDGFKLVFAEEFDGPLDVSPWGPGTRWIAHTPWNGDFGDARFVDPNEGFPFTVTNGILRIEARKDPAFAATDPYKRPWSAGLLSSNDAHGKGFSLQYGYFEMRAKMPPGPGVWPGFWLSSSFDRKDKGAGKDGSVEIDIVEYYGHSPSAYTATVHVWEPKPHRGVGQTITTRPNEVAEKFNTYGALVEPASITMYFNGIAVWKTATPEAHNKPLMILLNLALGSGWPIDKTPNPSFMDVDYVRAYALP
jgi:beta-glucanase (GH16 family)